MHQFALSFASIKPGEHQQPFNQMLKATALSKIAADPVSRLGFAVRRSDDLLEFTLDNRQWRTQLMRSVRQKTLRSLHRLPQPPEHVIERDRQALQCIA